MKRILLIGLDSAAPQLLFDKFIDRLPNLKKIMGKSVYGILESCDPAITIPAWMVMATSQSPGVLGLYGFRHRKGSSYKDVWIANSTKVKARKVWDYVADTGGRSCLVGVPPSYPPYPVKGDLVGCFITPDTNRTYTYPPELGEEIRELVGDYLVDVEFRLDDRSGTLKGIYEMTEKRINVVKHLLKTRDWRLFVYVEIGLDRIHHAFWRFFDKGHHLYEPGNQYEKVVEEYYVYLDKKVGEILELLDEDTIVIVASDHGTKGMRGCFCINEWLIEQGLLKLKKPVEKVGNLVEDDVDWEKTVAWGWGGYYARLFLNVKGREEQGLVNPSDYERVREELAGMIKNIRGPNGEEWNTSVYKPDELYPKVNGDAPDLMIYFDDLYWRSAGTLGHNTLYLFENDTGPDDSVHSKQGLYILYDPKQNYNGQNIDLNILDISPTILNILGIDIPHHMEGRPLNIL